MKNLEEKIYSALIQSSTCWSETPKGVFDKALADKIAEELIIEIHTHYNPMKALTNQLLKDPELYFAWQSNIAMAFIDRVKFNEMIDGIPVTVFDPNNVHNIANEAAKHFLNLLCDSFPKENDILSVSEQGIEPA